MTTKTLDPLNISERLYRQMARLLDDLEAKSAEITTPQRIMALQAIGRIQIMQMNLRLKDVDDPAHPGASVRKYASAFKTNAARGRANDRRARAADAALVSALVDDDDNAA